MSTRAGTYKEYKSNFHLDEGKLRKISDVVKNHASKLPNKTYINYRVNREDESFYDTSTIDEVLADDNTPGRSIKLIGIELNNTEESVERERHFGPEQRKALVIIIFDRFGKDEKVMVSLTVPAKWMASASASASPAHPRISS